MIKLKSYFLPATVLGIIWVILTENHNVYNLVSGFAIGVFCVFFSNKVLPLISSKNEKVKVRFTGILKYLAYLLRQIFYSGFDTIFKIIRGDFNIGIVEIETCLEDDLLASVLALSITLTPGTVALHRRDNKLEVLWIDCTTSDPQKAGTIIKKDFERILLNSIKRYKNC